jgi:tyrosine-protein kinase Etk/Wzc
MIDNSNEVVPVRVNDEEDNFVVKAFFAKLRSSWLVFIISIIAFGILGLLFMHYKAPSYNIEAKLLIEDNSNASNASSAVSSNTSSLIDLSSLLDIKSNVDNEVVVLQTRRMVEETVRDMNLNIVYYLRRYVTDQQMNRNPIIAQLLKPVDTVVTTTFKVWQVDSNRYKIKYKETYPNTSTATKSNTYYYGQQYFVAGVGIIRVLRNHQFGYGNQSYRFDIENVDQRIYELQQLMTISVTNTTVTAISLVFDYPIPDEGEAILTHLMHRYKQQNVILQNIVADSTISFLKGQLVLNNDQLQKVENELTIFKQRYKLADITEQGDLLLTTTNTYLDELEKNETELGIIKSLLDYLRDEKKNKTVVPVSVLPQDPEFASMVDSYNSLLIERDRELLTVTSKNPFMENMEARISSLRADMIKNLTTTQQSLVITNNDLKKSTNGFNNQIQAIPPVQKEYTDLEREQTVDQQLYVYLLQKLEETEMSKSSNLSIATTIDDAKADFKPYSPNLILVGIIVVFFGLAYPVARVLIKDILNTKILVKEDITKHTNVPIIGEISHNKTDKQLVVVEGSRSAISEQFRAMRTNLQYFINHENDEKVILVTSSVSGEGKSFITSNLAAVLAIFGKKVLLMEMDLRKPKLSSYFGLDNSNGFSNYIISNDTPLSSIIAPTNFHENLFIISSGPVPPNPAELISGKRTDQLITELKKQFDYIIIDAPPIGIITDAQLMNRFSDMSLYVVRQNYTLKNQLKIVDDLYVSRRLKKLAIIVNDIEVKQGYGYGYSYGYGYGYGYGYYEEDNESSKLSQLWKKTFRKKK